MGYIYTIADENGGGSAEIDSALNYSALPPPLSEEGFIWFVENSEGTAWLPGNLGGNYYPKGAYYSNGVEWIFQNSAAQATQSEVNTGVILDKFLSPNTFDQASKWGTKENFLTAGANITIDRTNPAAPVISSLGGGGGGTGNKFQLFNGDSVTVESGFEYFLGCNFILDAGSSLTLNTNSRVVLHDGPLTNNGVITNNGIIKIGL